LCAVSKVRARSRDTGSRNADTARHAGDASDGRHRHRHRAVAGQSHTVRRRHRAGATAAMHDGTGAASTKGHTAARVTDTRHESRARTSTGSGAHVRRRPLRQLLRRPHASAPRRRAPLVGPVRLGRRHRRRVSERRAGRHVACTAAAPAVVTHAADAARVHGDGTGGQRAVRGPARAARAAALALRPQRRRVRSTVAQHSRGCPWPLRQRRALRRVFPHLSSATGTAIVTHGNSRRARSS
jgi:hypothetical protein